MADLITDLKNARKTPVVGQNSAYVYEFAVKVPVSQATGTYTLPGVSIGPGTACAGIGISSIKDVDGTFLTWGVTATISLETVVRSGDTINGATTIRTGAVLTAETYAAPANAILNKVNGPKAVDLTFSIAAATAPATGPCTVYVSLLLVPLGKELPRQAAVGN
jgi:hypothetical protein